MRRSKSFYLARTTGACSAILLSLCTMAALRADPALGSGLGIPGLIPTGDLVQVGTGWGVPLRAARPNWYSAALDRRVLQAAGTPVAAPQDAPLPSEIGIRPGAWMISPHGCTMNFIFESGGELLIGTAGHCVDAVGQDVVILALTPGTGDLVLVDLGKVVARHENGIGDDFALVSIRPQLHDWVSPTTAIIGGPCGQYSGAGPEVISHYGHGLALGTGGTPRAGVALRWDVDSFGWDSPAIFGDSGSPVLVVESGEAAGDLTHLVVDSAWLPSFVAGTRIQNMLQVVAGLQLSKSPLCPGGDPGDEKTFIRGDANSDGHLDISDPIHVLNFLFLNTDGVALTCADAADADDSGALDISDAVSVFNFLFLGGPSPRPPFPEPGHDTTPDQLGACN